jgi:hypothetical protein
VAKERCVLFGRGCKVTGVSKDDGEDDLNQDALLLIAAAFISVYRRDQERTEPYLLGLRFFSAELPIQARLSLLFIELRCFCV